MSPELDKSFLQVIAGRSEQLHRFVRQDALIAVETSDTGHMLIAQRYNLTSPEDAGFIFTRRNRDIHIYGQSDTLRVGEEDSAERVKTINLVKKIAQSTEINIVPSL